MDLQRKGSLIALILYTVSANLFKLAFIVYGIGRTSCNVVYYIIVFNIFQFALAFFDIIIFSVSENKFLNELSLILPEYVIVESLLIKDLVESIKRIPVLLR